VATGAVILVQVLVLATGVGGASACLVVLVNASCGRCGGGCPWVVAVIVRVDESGGCGSAPSLKVNEYCKRDRGVYFHAVEDIRGKTTMEFQAWHVGLLLYW